MNETDEQLLERLRQSDATAFEQLFVRYYERVYRILYNLVGTREEAEDLVQETFLALYRQPPYLEGDSALIAWLSRVALNRGYNVLRSARRSQQRTDRLDTPISDPNDPLGVIVRAEERSQIQATLAQLPERQSKLLLLRYAGLSYAEIATALNVAPGSVGTLLARAERAFLKRYQNAVANLKGKMHHEPML